MIPIWNKIKGQATNIAYQINDAFDAFSNVISKLLPKDGSEPMTGNLDMNLNDIINIRSLDVSNLTLDGTPLTNESPLDIPQTVYVDTVSDLISVDTSSLGQYQQFSVAGYHQVGDGGGGVFVWDATADKSTANGGTIIDPSTTGGFNGSVGTRDAFLAAQGSGVGTGCWKLIHNGTINVKQFGAVGDGVTDDTDAIQSAIDTGNDVYLPSGTYITTDTLTASTIFMYGNTSVGSSTIKYTPLDGKPVIKTTGYYNNGKYITFRNLSITGVSDSTSVGIYLENLSAEDIDAYISDCHISTLGLGIYCKGRGLNVRNSIFSLLSTAIQLDRNNPVIEGANPDQKVETGQRAYMVNNNRFHGMGYGKIIYVDSSTNTDNVYTTGIQFNDNYIDTPAQIMVGACRSSEFCNNTHLYTGTSMLPLFESSEDWYRVNITGNMFGNLDRPTYYYYNRIVDLSGNVHSLNFSNNNIWKTKYEVIRMTKNVTDCVISNNIMLEVGLDLEYNSFPIIALSSSGYTVDNNNIVGNTVRLANEASTNVQANFDYFVYINTSLAYDSFITNNRHPYWAKVCNKATAPNGTVLRKYAKKQASNVTRNDTNALPQLLVSIAIAKKSETSYLFVRWNGIVKGNNGVTTNFPNIKIYVNGSWYENRSFYLDDITDVRKHVIVSDIVTTPDVTDVAIYVDDGTSSAQDFTIYANSLLTVEEVEQ